MCVINTQSCSKNSMDISLHENDIIRNYDRTWTICVIDKLVKSKFVFTVEIKLTMYFTKLCYVASILNKKSIILRLKIFRSKESSKYFIA